MNNVSDFSSLVGYIIGLLNLTVPVLFGIILLVLVWRIVAAWIVGGSDPEKIKEGKQTLLIGIIVLVVLSGIWGILNILRGSFFGG